VTPDRGPRSRPRSSWSLACAFAVTTFGGTAHAQTSQSAAAEALFEAGREQIASGELDEGCRKMEASQKIDPAVGTLLYLGDCQERLGRTASAWAAFREAASLARLSGQPQREEIATTRAAALEPRLSRVKVAVNDASGAIADLSI
jgi:hypothetical protein